MAIFRLRWVFAGGPLVQLEHRHGHRVIVTIAVTGAVHHRWWGLQQSARSSLQACENPLHRRVNFHVSIECPRPPVAEVPRGTRIACWRSWGALGKNLFFLQSLDNDGTWPGGPRVRDVPALSELLMALDGLR